MSDRGSPPEPPRGRPIDRSVLGEWLGDDNDAIDAMLADFRDSVRDEYARMAAAMEQGDEAAYSLAVHRLRGAAMSMGAHDLANAAIAIDIKVTGLDLDACRAGMAALEEQLELMAADIPSRP